ncbi:unnamed protein product [Amaranthus hypochondriacus]
MRTEEEEDERGSKDKTGRKLYFVKKLPQEENLELPKNAIHTVTTLFDKVSICHDQQTSKEENIYGSMEASVAGHDCGGEGDLSLSKHIEVFGETVAEDESESRVCRDNDSKQVVVEQYEEAKNTLCGVV